MSDLAYRIIHQDATLLAVDKPAGLTVHPGAGTAPGSTLTERVAADHPEVAGLERSGLVHRLDKGTSGVVVIARTPEAIAALSKQFAKRVVTKRYQALVGGRPEPAAAVLDAPITRHHADRLRMTVRPDGRAAETRYETVRTFGARATLLDVWPKTGRTHQIRVHLAALGHPIIGDATYGSGDPLLGRPFLHAAELQLTHPETGETLTLTAPLPPELLSYLETLDAETFDT